MNVGRDAADSIASAGSRPSTARPGPVPEWIRRLRPAVPSEVAALLVLAEDGYDDATAPSMEVLAEGAAAALERALSDPRSRETAWHLLGADALLTCACETALEDPRADGMLESLIQRVLVEPGQRREARDRD